MSRKRLHLNSHQYLQLHRQKLSAKIQKIEGLRSLLEMWKTRPDQVDHSYLLKLRARLRSAENQLAAMKP